MITSVNYGLLPSFLFNSLNNLIIRLNHYFTVFIQIDIVFSLLANFLLAEGCFVLSVVT